MNRTRAVILLLATLVVVAGLLYWAAPYFEPHEHEVTENVSEKVRRNPYLAMERFLERLGHAVASSRRTDILDTMPGAHDTLVLEYSAQVFTQQRTQKLISWVVRGGHLVMELTPSAWEAGGASKNALLGRLGLQPRQEKTNHQDDTDESGRTVVAGTQSFAVSFGYGDHWFEDGAGTAETWTADGVPTVLRYHLGEGRLTLIPDRDIWRNGWIGQQDHAALLAAIVGAPQGKVWLLYHVKVENLLELIWRHAAAAVSALAVTLALLLWGLNNRFGPLRVTEYRRRRRLGEHVEAMARFFWRHDRARTLLASARKELSQRAALRHPRFQSLAAADQIAWLADRIDGSPIMVRRALESTSERHDTLVENVALLQKLRNCL